MTKGSFVTGMIAGTVIGVGASMLINPMDDKDRRRISRHASQVFTTIGAMADRVIDMRK